jgi:hypothetical protein
VPAKGVTPDDRVTAIRVALTGLASGVDANDLAEQLGSLHPAGNTFPGEVMLDLAADALDVVGVSRDRPVEYRDMLERFLSECELRGGDHRKSHFALHAAAMIHGGVRPDLLEELAWWRADDFWLFATFALVVYARVAVEQSGEPIVVIAQQIGRRHGVDIAGP